MSTQHQAATLPDFGPGDRIRLLRRERLHMKQGALADALDVKRETLAAWEAGRNEAGITPAVARRIEILTGLRGAAAFVLGVLPDSPPPPDRGLPRLDSNQEPAGQRRPVTRLLPRAA